ncbi:SLBB domain-containing protein [Saccharicrinis aurantiacus]|uniref:SLBB domain-containing protein n=1 Tax=Saccharicrinis aurantiacus TaxID=1849719 RepID=UPI00248FE58F|nr:SLBB domain-containing protein [Saccharicrinis aurantiacus]
MRIKFSFLFLFFLCFFLSKNVVSQDIDPATVDVGALSDDQIQRIITEMDSRGIPEQEAMALAKARGMSDAQILQLQQRIQEHKLNGGGSSQVSELPEPKVFEEGEVSSKEKKEPTVVEEKKLFGYAFFNTDKLTFEPNATAPISPSYLIGLGDVIVIDVWGNSQMGYQLTVDQNGNVSIPEIGQVMIGGMSFEDAERKIKSKLNRIYADLSSDNPKTFASVSIAQIRAVSVNVIGEASSPGTYIVPGTASVFSALYLAGGPSENGSFRDIKLIRDEKVIQNIDIYDYLIKGKADNNVTLRDGDVIIIEPYRQRIIIEGQFKRTGLFETKKGETVTDVVEYAGGFNENAYTHRLELYRKNGRDQEFIDVLEDNYSKIELANGDSIVAGKVLNRFQNIVAITGAVYRPGNYEITEGLTLSKLIENADGLREDAFLERGVITRLAKDFTLTSISFDVADVVNGEVDFDIQKDDNISISSIHDLREFRTVEIYGEVKEPGPFNYKEGMTLSDIVYESGGFLESASEAFIEVARRLGKEEEATLTDKVSQVYQKQISRDLKLLGNDGDFELQPFDKIFIRQLPGFAEQSVVTLSGEIAYSGQYALTTHKDRVSDLIARCGGFSPNAYPKGAMLTRQIEKDTKNVMLKDELISRSTDVKSTSLDFEVVGISLDEIMKNPGGKDDVFLLDGDEIFVPRKSQVVKVTGEVLNPISSTYTKGRKLKKYISGAGGFAVQAKKNKVYVVYPNGTASDTKSFLGIRKYPKLEPGAEVIVPTRPVRNAASVAAWVGILSSLATLGLTISNIVN